MTRPSWLLTEVVSVKDGDTRECPECEKPVDGIECHEGGYGLVEFYFKCACGHEWWLTPDDLKREMEG